VFIACFLVMNEHLFVLSTVGNCLSDNVCLAVSFVAHLESCVAPLLADNRATKRFYMKTCFSQLQQPG
jgi:hypothetical protein